MNRRGFLRNIALAAASFGILPSATTYARKWVKPSKDSNLYIPNDEYINAPYEVRFIFNATVFESKIPLHKVAQPVVFKREEFASINDFVPPEGMVSIKDAVPIRYDSDMKRVLPFKVYES